MTRDQIKAKLHKWMIENPKPFSYGDILKHTFNMSPDYYTKGQIKDFAMDMINDLIATEMLDCDADTLTFKSKLVSDKTKVK